jgi:hypothetical protein
MKKVIRLTESDLIRLVKRVIKEQEDFPKYRDYDNDESYMDAARDWDSNNQLDYETFDDDEELSSLIDQQKNLTSNFPKYSGNDYENEEDYMGDVLNWAERSGYDELEGKVSILRDKRDSINDRNKQKLSNRKK